MYMRNYNGWIPQKHDPRDFIFKASKPVSGLPTKVDLRDKMPPVYDQLQLGSCTANAIAAAYDYQHFVQGNPYISPSRLFIYFNERAVEGTIKQDSGAQIRDGIKVINSQGVCPELNWPYKISKFKTKPTKACYA